LRSPVGRLTKRTIIVRRLKGSTDSSHYLERDELAGLKLLRRQQADTSAYNERGEPFGRMGVAKPGQILISPRVLMKVETAVKVEPVGEFELKGIRRPLAAYNVLAALA
jgi:hypothetical protein